MHWKPLLIDIKYSSLPKAPSNSYGNKLGSRFQGFSTGNAQLGQRNIAQVLITLVTLTEIYYRLDPKFSRSFLSDFSGPSDQKML